MLRIKNICREKGISQRVLAQKLGITYQALHSMVVGNPTLDTLQKITTALDVPITELFTQSQQSQGFTQCPQCGAKLKLSTL